MHAQQIISTHPHVRGNTNDALIRCIEECYDCAQTCTACADACLAEDRVKDLTQCIRMCLDCTDVCAATGSLASRRTGSDEILLRVAAPLALIISILVEIVTRVDGIGALMGSAQANFRSAQVYGLLALAGIIGFLVNWAVTRLESVVGSRMTGA